MSNFMHYYNKIKSGDTFFSLNKKMSVISNIISIYEIILSIFFLKNNIYSMMFLSILIAAYYMVIVNNLLRLEKYTSSMLMSILIVVVTSFTSSIFLGFSTGFSYYLFGALAACFYLTFMIENFQNKTFIPLMLSLFFLACYIFNYVATLFVEPFFKLNNDQWIGIFHISNLTISFLIVILFNFLFVWEIKSRNKLLFDKNIQLNEMAHKDPLTMLYNRRSMNEYLDKSIKNLKNTGKRFSLILGDIDDFKHVNDNYGHDAGDAVLVNVSNVITSTIGDSGVVCRWGGEEILILVYDSIEASGLLAERIRKKLEESVVTFENYKINVTITLGISESIPGYKIEQLIQQADDKLYTGKRNGKNQVVI